MTPSIIRRFARYHGIDLADVHEDDVLVAVMRGIRTNSETQASAHDRLIQFLTRIDCAEGAFVQSELTNSHPLHIYGQDLLLKAGITDLDMWEGTKE